MIDKLQNVLTDSKKAIQLDSKNVKAYVVYAQALAKSSKYSRSLDELYESIQYCRDAVLISKKEGSAALIIQCKDLKNKIKAMLITKTNEMRSECIENLKTYYSTLIRRNPNVLDMFIKFVKPKIPEPIPEVLCCPITLVLFKDPVITTSGNTYDKEELYLHMSKVGSFDPMTRERIEYKNNIRNISIIKAVNYFMKSNPWSYVSDRPVSSLEYEI